MFGMNSINFSLDIGRENMFVSCDPKKNYLYAHFLSLLNKNTPHFIPNLLTYKRLN